ncbi:MAG: hypothetical protein DMF27_11425 [Verrucomicrobia bacterium]|nr:MAG: hypothetical protein DMF27_11425 [Verrucomicrobiota bacterium]
MLLLLDGASDKARHFCMKAMPTKEARMLGRSARRPSRNRIRSSVWAEFFQIWLCRWFRPRQ